MRLLLHRLAHFLGWQRGVVVSASRRGTVWGRVSVRDVRGSDGQACAEQGGAAGHGVLMSEMEADMDGMCPTEAWRSMIDEALR